MASVVSRGLSPVGAAVRKEPVQEEPMSTIAGVPEESTAQMPTLVEVEGNAKRPDSADVASITDSHMAGHPPSPDIQWEQAKGIDDTSTNTPEDTSSAAETARYEPVEEPVAIPLPSVPRPPADGGDRGRRIRRPAAPFPSAVENHPTHNWVRPGSSSDSESTITQSSSEQTLLGDMDSEDDAGALISQAPPRPTSRPNPLSFLEPDSPAITPESIRRSIDESTARWRASQYHRKSPSALSSASSGSSSTRSDVFSQSDLETNWSSSPEQSIQGSYPTPQSIAIRTQFATDPRRQQHPGAKSYGTPEMPRGKANLPHIPPNALQPRLSGQSNYVKHLPRAEKLPPSGYQLLASKLSSSQPVSRPIQPMYRRFETLNHRILLHLQDELAEMEEQLHRLDTADTQTRRLKSCILPASRRTESLTGGELQWHKTDILGKIGYKLEQYNRVLSSFVQTQGLANPSASELEEYRSFLEVQNPIAELETRFLDAPDDLVALRSPGFGSPDCLSSGTPAPALPNKEASDSSRLTSPLIPAPHDVSVPSLAAALAISVLLPVLSFSSIPGFLGRMTVIWLVAVGVLNPLLQAGGLRGAGIRSRDAVACAAIYGSGMSVVAAMFS